MVPDAVLALFWWLVLGGFVAAVGILLAGELGLAVLLPWLARTEDERRRVLAQNPSPVSGQAVWLVLLGGAVVGAWWPLFHASLFSGLWLVLLFLIVAVMVGPVGHSYREVMPTKRVGLWDSGWALASLAALLVMGMGVGTTISGVPLQFNANADPLWGGFIATFTPYDVLVPGIMAVALGVLLAAARIATRCSGEIEARARQLLIPAGGLAFLTFLGGAIWATQFPGYAIGYTESAKALTNPFYGTTFLANGAYLEQYLGSYPMQTAVGSWPLLVVPIFAAIMLLLGMFFAWRGRIARTWPLACLAVMGIVATAGATTYPIILPSYSAPAQSLTLWNASMPAPVLISYLVWLGVLIPAAVGYEIWARRRGIGTGGVATPNS